MQVAHGTLRRGNLPGENSAKILPGVRDRRPADQRYFSGSGPLPRKARLGHGSQWSRYVRSSSLPVPTRTPERPWEATLRQTSEIARPCGPRDPDDTGNVAGLPAGSQDRKDGPVRIL